MIEQIMYRGAQRVHRGWRQKINRESATSTQHSVHRILQVTASLAPRDGGPTTGITALNAAFRQAGKEALVLATDANGPTERLHRNTGGPIEQMGARILYCKRSRPRRLKNSWQQARRLCILAQTASIMHIHGVYLAHTIWAYLAAKKYHVPYVIQPHGTLEPYQEKEGRIRKRLFNLVVGSRILRGASLIIAASGQESSNLRILLPGIPVTVAPLGVDLPPPGSPIEISDSLRSEIVRRSHSKRVAFVGRLASKKRPDLLMDAWNRVNDPDAVLIMAGPEENWTRSNLLSRLAPERRGSVVMLEELSRAAVAWLLSEVSIFVLPSENENFGIAIAEAMAQGCAVVTTTQTASSEHVLDAEAGIVLPSPSTVELCAAIEELLHEESRTRLMGTNGATYAREKLSWRRTASIILESYNDIVC